MICEPLGSNVIGRVDSSGADSRRADSTDCSGFVAGCCGIEQRLTLDFLCRRAGGHTGTDGDPAQLPSGTVGNAQGLDIVTDTIGDDRGAERIGLGQQDGKLFATDTGRAIAGASQGVVQALRDPFETLIACAVAVGVVVLLEIVHVQQHQRDGRSTTLGASPLDLEDISEMASVGDAGQGIHGGQLDQQITLLFLLEVAADAGLDRRDVEGLGDVVDHSPLEPPGLVLPAVLGGEEDDRNVLQRGILLQTAADLVAIHLRHHDVQQDQVGLVYNDHLEGLLAAGGDLHQVVAFQRLHQHPAVCRNVIDDQHPGFRIMGGQHFSYWPLAYFRERYSLII